MRKIHQYIRQTLLHWIDFFYPPFKKIMLLQTFRYAACGSGNVVLDISLFTICYNFIVKQQIVDLGFVAISPYIFSFIFSFCISFPVGFYLSRYVVWQQTGTSKRIQLFRYFLVVMMCVLLNYVFLKIFMENLGMWPTVAKIGTTPLVAAFSYFSQRHFSFKSSK